MTYEWDPYGEEQLRNPDDLHPFYIRCRKELKTEDFFIDDLRKRLETMETIYQPLPGECTEIGERSNDDMRRYRNSLHLDCDKVDENVYLGTAYTAKDKDYLKKLGITDILNVALASGPDYAETPEGHYDGTELNVLAIQISNDEDEDIGQHFPKVVKFIGKVADAGGKVLIHGKSGLSRSAACAIAWLIHKHRCPLGKSVEIVRKLRPIQLNKSFLFQLCIFYYYYLKKDE